MKSLEIYKTLKNHFGAVGSWWPKNNPFEVIIGAILTQQSTWTNVEKAIKNLKDNDILFPSDIAYLPVNELKELIRPSGFFNQKADRLRNMLLYLMDKYEGKIELFLGNENKELRKELLELKGVGPETADSIILYSAEKAEFVVDAYTKRIYSRLGLVKETIDYDSLKDYIIKEIPKELILYQEYHGLLVLLGKNLCKKQNPKCDECPLKEKCKYNKDI